MLHGNTKKMYRLTWKYTIIVPHHELTPRGRGASEGCRPKLPRWPFSVSSGTHTLSTTVDESMVRNPGGESSFFLQCPPFFCARRAECLGVTLLPPASFLAS